MWSFVFSHLVLRATFFPHARAQQLSPNVQARRASQRDQDYHCYDDKTFVEVEASRRAANIKKIQQLLFVSHCWRDPSMQLRKRLIIAHLSKAVEVRRPKNAYTITHLPSSSAASPSASAETRRTAARIVEYPQASCCTPQTDRASRQFLHHKSLRPTYTDMIPPLGHTIGCAITIELTFSIYMQIFYHHCNLSMKGPSRRFYRH